MREITLENLLEDLASYYWEWGLGKHMTIMASRELQGVIERYGGTVSRKEDKPNQTMRDEK